MAAASNEMPLTQLGPSPDYTGISAAHGAHAKLVEDPADLRGAIRQALQVVREDCRQALLEVRIA